MYRNCTGAYSSTEVAARWFLECAGMSGTNGAFPLVFSTSTLNQLSPIWHSTELRGSHVAFLMENVDVQRVYDWLLWVRWKHNLTRWVSAPFESPLNQCRT